MADNKSPRAEVIAALVTDKYSGFHEGDEAILEAASDARLEEFRTASDAAKASMAAHVRLENEHRNVSARLKVAEDRLKESEQPMTEEEFISKAPESIKSTLTEIKAAEATERAEYITQLVAVGVDSESELKKKSISELKTLAKYARITLPDFSGRGLPHQRALEERPDYTPPNPYDEGLKALRAQRTVN